MSTSININITPEFQKFSDKHLDPILNQITKFQTAQMRMLIKKNNINHGINDGKKYIVKIKQYMQENMNISQLTISTLKEK